MPALKISFSDAQPIKERKLEKEGMKIATTYNGQEAFNSLTRNKPYLILLDMMIQDIDGIAICQRFQTNKASRAIPITAKKTRTSRLRT